MIGIVGLGMYAPPTVRTNAFWPRDLVERWTAAPRPRPVLPAQLTPGMRCVLEAAGAYASDPFQGVVERRVMGDAETLEDMQEHAAREALARAGITGGDVGLLLTHTVVTPHQLVNPACELHERLHLARECLAAEVEATAYSVFAQLALAEAAITAGRAKFALLVQASAGSRLVDPTDPLSVLGGDAATAIVLGRVGATRGVRALVHFTDGRYPKSLVLDRNKLIPEPRQLWEAQLQIADVCRDSVELALRRAETSIADIDYLCAFQGTAWLHRAVATHLGATAARSTDVFARYGYLSSAAIAANLYLGQQQGLLLRDDVVVLTGGGTGQTYGAAVLRWGNA